MGYRYAWTCPKCHTRLDLHKRVTQTKRRCPHCGTPITPEEIDRQAKANAIGCVIGCLIGGPIIIFMFVLLNYLFSG
jgi:hypothetical protein